MLHLQQYQDVQLTLLQHHIKIYSDQEMSKNKHKKVLVFADLVILNQCKGHSKWYNMTKVNDTYKHGRYENKLIKRFASDDQSFCLGGQLTCLNTTDDIAPHVANEHQ